MVLPWTRLPPRVRLDFRVETFGVIFCMLLVNPFRTFGDCKQALRSASCFEMVLYCLTSQCVKRGGGCLSKGRQGCMQQASSFDIAFLLDF